MVEKDWGIYLLEGDKDGIKIGRADVLVTRITSYGNNFKKLGTWKMGSEENMKKTEQFLINYLRDTKGLKKVGGRHAGCREYFEPDIWRGDDGFQEYINKLKNDINSIVKNIKQTMLNEDLEDIDEDIDENIDNVKEFFNDCFTRSKNNFPYKGAKIEWDYVCEKEFCNAVWIWWCKKNNITNSQKSSSDLFKKIKRLECIKDEDTVRMRGGKTPQHNFIKYKHGDPLIHWKLKPTIGKKENVYGKVPPARGNKKEVKSVLRYKFILNS